MMAVSPNGILPPTRGSLSRFSAPLLLFVVAVLERSLRGPYVKMMRLSFLSVSLVTSFINQSNNDRAFAKRDGFFSVSQRTGRQSKPSEQNKAKVYLQIL